ncbi:hypothetical protein CcI49_11420 [Frankia sp. CcI49]|nr:hypothetical protein CcI49_11420 [Frankia sp. CcI49]
MIDFGQYIAGPLVAQLLADYGADVIRVDPPGGPVWKNDCNAILQRGKRSISLDLKDPDDAEIARKLVDSADVLIENFRPGVMDRLGLGSAEALARNPGLVYCSIPGFAADDPRATCYASEGVVAAVAGLYPPQDLDWSAAPVVNTLPLASVSGALTAVNAVVAALIARERCGLGQRIEVSLYDATYELTRVYGDIPPGSKTGHAPPRGFGSSSIYPIARSYECADGRWVRITWLEGRQVADFGKLVGKYEDWKALGFLEAGVQRIQADPELVESMTAEISAAFMTQPADHWEREVGLIADLTVIRTSREWLLYDVQAHAIGGSVELVDPELGVTKQAGSPVTLTATPATPTSRHQLDADRNEILAELESGGSRREATVPGGEAIPLGSALEGIRAVDTTVLLAGPAACRLLAEFGAEVVHVGNPNWRGMTTLHYQTQGGKRTTLLDLKKPGALDIFYRLTESADIVSTNYSQSVGDRLGVGEKAIREYNANVIYSRVSAHGVFGPRAEYRGHEEIGQAVTGALLRFSKTPAGNMQFHLINDSGTGQLAAFGIMVALFHRMRTGVGQFVGSSLAQTCVTWQTPYMIDHRARDWDDPGGLDFRGYSPLEHVYKGSDGRWFYLSVKPSTDLSVLASVAGLDGVDTVAPESLEAELAERFAGKPASAWVAELNGGDPGIGAGIAATFSEVMSDDWARGHGLVQEVDFRDIGRGTLIGPAPRLSLTPMRLGTPVGPPGCDSRAVIEDLGLGARTDDLIAQGVIRETADQQTHR